MILITVYDRSMSPEELIAEIFAEPTWINIATSYTGNRDDAEEAMQDATIKFLRKIDTKGYHEVQARAFWSQCLRWTCINFVRNKRNRPQKADFEPEWHDIAIDYLSPEDQVIVMEEVQEAVRISKEMAPAQREAVVLFLDGLNYEEIAERTGKSIPSVKSCLVRGRERFRREIKLAAA